MFENNFAKRKLMIEKPMISEKFDLDDIRKIREYNSLRHIEMTPEEIIADVQEGAAEFLAKLKAFHESEDFTLKTSKEPFKPSTVIAEEPGKYTDKTQ